MSFAPIPDPQDRAPKGCPDPITMKPDQLIFAHWHLSEQYGDLMEASLEEYRLGEHADLTRLSALEKDLDALEAQLKQNEMFLRMAGFDNMEIYQ